MSKKYFVISENGHDIDILDHEVHDTREEALAAAKTDLEDYAKNAGNNIDYTPTNLVVEVVDIVKLPEPTVLVESLKAIKTVDLRIAA